MPGAESKSSGRLSAVADLQVLLGIILTFFLDMTISIDYFILTRGWSHEDNGH
jgi:hypothetical protein